MYIDGGTSLPLAVFASTQPTTYLFSGLIDLENGKEYIIAVDMSSIGTLTAIEINDQQQPLSFAQPTTFFQSANVTSGNINLTIPDILKYGTLQRFNSLASFLPLGTTALQVSGISYDLSFENLTDRTLLIATGPHTSPDLFHLQGPTMGADTNAIK